MATSKGFSLVQEKGDDLKNELKQFDIIVSKLNDWLKSLKAQVRKEQHQIEREKHTHTQLNIRKGDTNGTGLVRDNAISMITDETIRAWLLKAKDKAVQEEKELISSLGPLELEPFLREAVRIESVLDEEYAALKKEQQTARSLHAPNIGVYQAKTKPTTR
ncbi:hypothetical protein RFI_21212, partial [Reticulomyxa filosa]